MSAKLDTGYVQALIDKGLDPRQARELARKKVSDQSLSTGQTPDLFTPAAEPKPSKPGGIEAKLSSQRQMTSCCRRSGWPPTSLGSP